MAYSYPVATVGSVFLMTLRMTWCNQQLRNVYHFRLDQNSNNRSIDVVATALHSVANTPATGLYATHAALRDQDCVLNDVQIQAIDPARYVAIGFALNQAGAITTLSPNLDTPNLAAVLTRRAVVATRRGVSSLHIPLAISTDTMANGSLTVAAQTDLGDHGNAILSIGSLGDGITMSSVIYHKAGNPLTNDIESFFAETTVRTMRRRTVGRGI